MFRAKTVLVVGAGASCEANFPDGAKLLTDIKQRLDIRFRHNQMQRGDYSLSDALLDFAGRKFGPDFNEWLQAAWRIRDAAQIGLSIDNVIEQHDDDERVALVGKLAIVRSILQAEAASLLAPIGGGGPEIDLNPLRGTWYVKLAQVLTEGVSRARRDHLFENLSIICFNYDRAIQQFLPQALVNAWGLKLEEARQLVGRLKILHPYGRISPLPYEAPQDAWEFGSDVQGRKRLPALAANIRTFSERIEDDASIGAIRETVAEAEQIIFLGFAFHRQNMELLGPADPQARRALATTWNLPDNETRQIAKQLRNMFRLAEGVDGLVLHNGNCASLFSENWRTITGEAEPPDGPWVM